MRRKNAGDVSSVKGMKTRVGSEKRTGTQGEIKSGADSDRELKKNNRFLDSLQLPKDVCTGAMRVTLTGNMEAWIENYRGLLEYSEEAILLQGKSCQVCFEGSCLSIDYYTNEDMKISGHICCVKYL